MSPKFVLPWLALALFACSKKEPAATPEQLPYRSASAFEVFHLRSECAKLGNEILDDEVVGTALHKDVATHYNPKTNRCYAELSVMPVDAGSNDSANYLFDAQTKELLAYITVKAGKKAFMNLARVPTGDPNEANLPQDEQVSDAIRATMDDDRRN